MLKPLLVATSALSIIATLAFGGSDNRVPYRSKVVVKVGQSIVIHGLRGKFPKKSAVASMEAQYGGLKVGKIISGKRGVRKSRSCKGDTPVIEAIFVAQKKGRVKIDLFGDEISIKVK